MYAKIKLNVKHVIILSCFHNPDSNLYWDFMFESDNSIQQSPMYSEIKLNVKHCNNKKQVITLAVKISSM